MRGGGPPKGCPPRRQVITRQEAIPRVLLRYGIRHRQRDPHREPLVGALRRRELHDRQHNVRHPIQYGGTAG
jgi:hypothetical protein